MDFTSYPKIHTIGTRGFENIATARPLWYSEKLDGSNVSIHKLSPDDAGTPFSAFKLASHHRWLVWQTKDDIKMFKPFIQWCEDNFHKLTSMRDGTILWGEMVMNQGVLKYSIKSPFMLFDVSHQNEFGVREFVSPSAWDLYLPTDWNSFIPGVIPIEGGPPTPELLAQWIETDSSIGGKREGVVIKSYEETAIFGGRAVPLFVKYVAPEFRERMKAGKPTGDTIETLIANMCYGPARLQKAIQRLKEENRYQGAVQDIGPLIGIINKDIYEEEKAEIMEMLFKHFWKPITRIVTSRIPNDYKALLLAGADGTNCCVGSDKYGAIQCCRGPEDNDKTA